jgi:pyruvate dehydrogenase E2 component (dihydrolipoamide acetyltransferase)
MPDVIMPRLSDSMEEGTILRWLKAHGEHVERGDDLLEIETDKATMTYEADAAGVLTIVVEEGATVPVGAVIGSLGETAVAPGRQAKERLPASAASAAAPAASAAGGTAEVLDRGPNGSGGDRLVALAPPHGNGPAKASPLARRTAQSLGVDLATVVGSGPNSRILKSDVLAAAQRVEELPANFAEAARGAAASATPLLATSRGEAAFEELTRTQALIARRMAESRATIPEFALQVDVDMGTALEMRTRLKDLADPAPSLNDIIIKACALALARHPRVNGSYRDGRFEFHPRVNVGVAVAADKALVVPTIFDADTKTLGTIAAETRQLIERVHDGKISPAELSGGTFTVSNLGMFGIDRFEGIINAPQAAILCVGVIRERASAVDGQVAVRPMMSMTLACDHRILYGADAAQFLNAVRQFLEQPFGMLL